MNTTNLDSVIRKIEKCLALSKSSNEGEAAAALRQAQKLMAAYNVTAEALAGAAIGESRADTNAWTRPPGWEMHLLNIIKVAFGCEALLFLGSGVTKRLTQVSYIGVKHQAKLAAFAHEVLRRQVERDRTRYTATLAGYSRGEKIKAGEAFSIGYVENLRRQVDALAVPTEQAERIQARKAAMMGDPDKAPYKPNKVAMDYNALRAGAEAGKHASLHRPLTEQEVRPALS